jgi:hypothetical protein
MLATCLLLKELHYRFAIGLRNCHSPGMSQNVIHRNDDVAVNGDLGNWIE